MYSLHGLRHGYKISLQFLPTSSHFHRAIDKPRWSHRLQSQNFHNYNLKIFGGVNNDCNDITLGLRSPCTKICSLENRRTVILWPRRLSPTGRDAAIYWISIFCLLHVYQNKVKSNFSNLSINLSQAFFSLQCLKYIRELNS